MRFERISDNTVKFFRAYKTFLFGKSVSIKHFVHELKKRLTLASGKCTNSITNDRAWFQKSEFLRVCSEVCRHVIGPLWICGLFVILIISLNYLQLSD